MPLQLKGMTYFQGLAVLRYYVTLNAVTWNTLAKVKMN